MPRYQRLYVWENHQVENMFEDLYEAFRTNKEYYYLGGILLVNDKSNMKIYDLVDGQQRFTTLWLLSVELGGRLKDFSVCDNQLRLLFSIRKRKAIF
ncbi:MAG: DUF262 domain-containing protein [Bacteroidetes bacterium]|nr:DUF262 domain-containing protein [Bacteroidota bacterium]